MGETSEHKKIAKKWDYIKRYLIPVLLPLLASFLLWAATMFVDDRVKSIKTTVERVDAKVETLTTEVKEIKSQLEMKDKVTVK